MYVPSPLVFLYLSGIYKACSNDAGRILMIARTQNLTMTLEMFGACSSFHPSRKCENAQSKFHQFGFNVSVPMDMFNDLDIVSQ